MLKIETLDFESTEIEAYNQRQAAIQSEVDGLPALQAQLVTAASSESVARLTSEAARLAARPFELHRMAVALAEAEAIKCHEALAKLAADSLKAAEAAHTKATDNAEKSLRKSGLAPESDPNFGVNPESARNKFAYTVSTCEAVRTANMAVDQAREDLLSCKRNANLWHDDLDHAKSELRALVRHLLGV